MCRQVLREFCALDMPVLLVPGDYFQYGGTGGEAAAGVRVTSVGELLPDSFGPEHLGFLRA